MSEVILNEQDQKKRTALLKYFVKLTVSLAVPSRLGASLADISFLAILQTRLVDLQNYSGGVAVLAALNGSSITRLKKTWEVSRNRPAEPTITRPLTWAHLSASQALPTKSKNSHHALRNLFDVSRNHAVVRPSLSSRIYPFLSLTPFSHLI